jgi:hypothetical protein
MLRNQRDAVADSPQVSGLCERLRLSLSSAHAVRGRFALIALLACTTYAPQFAHAQSLCTSCEVQLGVGGTYHFWASTGGTMLPVTVTWSERRYEVGIFRFATSQILNEALHPSRLMADPYWGVSASRRWQLFAHGPLSGFVGFGLAYRSESDILSVTRWDFASQVALRLQRSGGHSAVEFSIRHWSNGGCRLPNHGQDFATLTVRFNP